MPEPLLRALAAGTGLILGAFFFGGLWWTVRIGVSSERVVLWFSVSLLLRTSIVLTGFYLVAGGRWDRMLICLLGFVVARVVVTWLTRPPDATPNRGTRVASDAS